MNDTTTVAITAALVGGGILIAHATNQPQRRVGGGPAAGIPAGVARRLDVIVEGRHQATLQDARTAMREAAAAHGHARFSIRDRLGGGQLSCDVVPAVRKARGGRTRSGHRRR